MKKSTTIILQTLIILLAIGVVTFLLWQPTVEGVNVGKPLFDIYFKDPFVAFAYIASIPFFVALYQGFKALGHAGRGSMNSPAIARSLAIIRTCAFLSIGFVVVGEIILFSQPSDDRPPLIAMGTILVLISLAVAAWSGRLRNKIQVVQ